MGTTAPHVQKQGSDLPCAVGINITALRASAHITCHMYMEYSQYGELSGVQAMSYYTRMRTE